MAGTSLLALIDDIATVLDDITIMTKVAAKKTAGVLGDDLALNAQQVSGIRADRELPVVWEVAKGSFKNKLILVPAALILSAFLPMLITPLLIFGGLFLCFEGAEKIWHLLAHKQERAEHKKALHDAISNPKVNMAQFEQDKIKGAIRTDFILSAEIIVIALGTASDAPFSTQAAVISLIALAMTFGVYGLVALIVKLDDIGLHLLNGEQADFLSGLKKSCGKALLAFCPWLMKGLSFFGTAAMFLVGGGILMHGVPILHHLLESNAALLFNPMLTELVFNLIAGLLSGFICVFLLSLLKTLRSSKSDQSI